MPTLASHICGIESCCWERDKSTFGWKTLKQSLRLFPNRVYHIAHARLGDIARSREPESSFVNALGASRPSFRFTFAKTAYTLVALRPCFQRVT
jgi:hypothetical protein